MFKDVIEDIKKNAEADTDIRTNSYTGENGLLYCLTCNEPKQKRLKTKTLDTIVPCKCKCQIEAIEQETAERKEREWNEHIQSLRKNGMPEKRMHSWTFENDDNSNLKIKQAMVTYVDNFSEMEQQGKGLLLYGGFGTGKTFSACQIANALIDKGIKVKVTDFARILNEMQGSFEKQAYIDALMDCKLLILDDLGAERKSEYAKEQVFNVINARYNSGKPMIITTNLSLNELINPDDIDNARTYDRIMQNCHLVEFEGGSKHRSQLKSGYAEMNKILGITQ